NDNALIKTRSAASPAAIARRPSQIAGISAAGSSRCAATAANSAVSSMSPSPNGKNQSRTLSVPRRTGTPTAARRATDRHPAPDRAARATILQEQVGLRERHDRDPGAGKLLDQRARGLVVEGRQHAEMAERDPAEKAERDHRIGDARRQHPARLEVLVE